MYKLIVFLLILIAGLQYRLWLGDGGIREYRETTTKIEELRQEGEKRRVRNAALAADVKDLKEGTDAIEERARHDLGMIKSGETFIQIYDSSLPAAGSTSTQAAQPHRSPPGRPRDRRAEPSRNTTHD